MLCAAAELVCHPQAPSTAVKRIQSTVRLDAGVLRVTYVLSGVIRQLRIPEARAPQRRDELWRHTCCELFIGSTLRAEYREFNFSPSGEWAAYRFEAYRQGMAPLALQSTPTVRVRSDDSSLTLDVDLDSALVDGSRDLKLALSTVVEESSGRVSYWALKHPEGKPDFHHLDGFVLNLYGREPKAG